MVILKRLEKFANDYFSHLSLVLKMELGVLRLRS